MAEEEKKTRAEAREAKKKTEAEEAKKLADEEKKIEDEKKAAAKKKEDNTPPVRTPIAMTNHTYWNLSGNYRIPNIRTHRLKLYCDKVVDVDDLHNIP